MPGKKEIETPGFLVDNKLPMLFADSFASNRREDGLYIIVFGASIPEGVQEQARLTLPTESVKNLIDLLCDQSEYYPTKPNPKKKSPKKKTAVAKQS